jgi:L-lactate utilization protein LutC
MNPAREAFLQRVRQAVAAGNRPGVASALPVRGETGYQGGGTDPVARFCAELAAAGGQGYVVPDARAATAKVLELVQSRSARNVLLGRGAVLDRLELASPLQASGVEVTAVDGVSTDNWRDTFFAADLGITGVEYLVAETGTVVMYARFDEPRSASLLPPVHIAVAERSQLLPDLFDLFGAEVRQDRPMPSCLTLITGPSKTGDIELRLVTGVHGPGEVHVVLIVPDAAPATPAPG